ncbi:hypothetical protein MJ585_28075 [Klebsiella pneumoniae]|nr:hypothetical protein MJ585_28075 [Klebsiella pneumoniae]
MLQAFRTSLIWAPLPHCATQRVFMELMRRIWLFPRSQLTLEDDSYLRRAARAAGQPDKYATKHPDAFKAASKVNLMRGFGRHAAGMIVAGVPLTERTPVERRGDARCIAFDKRYREAMGADQTDVLAWATLDPLDSAKRYIKESTGKDINLDAIPLDDRKVL